MYSSTATIGEIGERAACRWLRDRGYLICDLNWRSGRYELDIVAQRWDITHFVEVKCRKADGFTTPEEAMTPKKRESLIKAARSYIACHALRGEVQFDLVAVDLYPDGSTNIRLVENAVEFRW